MLQKLKSIGQLIFFRTGERFALKSIAYMDVNGGFLEVILLLLIALTPFAE